MRIPHHLVSMERIQCCVTGCELYEHIQKRNLHRVHRDYFEVCVPATDSRFSTAMQPVSNTETGRASLKVSSAWSERHAAYVAGLGTFSLTRALISERGMAGRYGSFDANTDHSIFLEYRIIPTPSATIIRNAAPPDAAFMTREN